MAVTHTPQMVFTGEDGNVFTWAPSHKRQQQLTWSWEEHEVEKDSDTASLRLTHLWPAWAPDGKQVACFGMRGTPETQLATSLYAVAADGIESWELSGLSGGMPIYGNWSPQGDAFAALVQRGRQQLSLEIVRLDQPGKMTPTISGAPLFWSWSPRGDMLAVHVGGTRHVSAVARVVLIDARSGQIRQQLTDHPGEFRVPAWSPSEDLLTYVEQDTDGSETLLLYDVHSGEKGPIAHVDGGTATVWSADGKALAFATVSQPDSFVFPQIQTLALNTGHISTVLEEPVLSFFWSPRGDCLVYLSIDQQQNYLHWHRVSPINRETAELVRFLPSREQMFIFSFFDQYALSHPPLAPDGNTLAFAGYLISSTSATTTSQVYALPLDDPTAVPTAIAPGQFVSWNL